MATKRQVVSMFESRFVRPEPGPTLIMGSKVYKKRQDRRKLYPNAIGIDMEAGEGVDWVWDCEDPFPAGVGPFSHVDCLSVLEHAKRPWLIAQNIEKVLEPGGTLFVSVPFVWRVHGYPDDYWRFTASAVRLLFPGITWRQLVYGDYDLLPEGQKLPAVMIEGRRYFIQTETCGFGEKRAQS